MARGNKKSMAVSIKTREDDLEEYRDTTDKAEMASGQSAQQYNKQLLAVADKMLDEVAEYGGEPRAWFEEFLGPLTRYQGDRHFEHKGHKERRERIAASFEGLPQYVKDFIAMPKSVISTLARGGDHAANPGPDGTINASFSGNRAWAKTFADGGIRSQFGHKKYEGAKPRLYDSKDIESFKHIISLQRSMDLINSMSLALTNKYGAFPKDKSIRSLKDDLELASSRLTRYQAEYIVTDIKWKDDVT